MRGQVGKADAIKQPPKRAAPKRIDIFTWGTVKGMSRPVKVHRVKWRDAKGAGP
jgi:hypothetical protein